MFLNSENDEYWKLVWEIILSVAVTLAFVAAGILFTLPTSFDPWERRGDMITEDAFSDEDKKEPERSGYAAYQKYRAADGTFKLDATVQVVVLGDIGRSPRMQYHALSIAAHGGRVELVGYTESDVHPDIVASRLIKVIPLPPTPGWMRTSNKLLFLLLGPLKVLWQLRNLYYTLGYETLASKWMLVQNPPSIPTLVAAQLLCFFRNTRLVIDWHNFGFSILAMKLGSMHPLVVLYRWYEWYYARGADAHFAVTDAMVRVLKKRFGITAMALHDRPRTEYKALSPSERSAFLHRLPETAQYASDIEQKSWRLIVSSTSWTPDEDFSLLLDAMVSYSSAVTENSKLPRILAIITGKGPRKQYYLDRISQLNQDKKLQNLVITTAWLSTEDYASLLGSADLGVSLHTSSSGVDLPMKVVDMFGTGLPVAGWNKYEAWPELVTEGVNGRGFDSAADLATILEELLKGDSKELEKLRQGVLKEGDRSWDDVWMPIAGKLFGLQEGDLERANHLLRR